MTRVGFGTLFRFLLSVTVLAIPSMVSAAWQIYGANDLGGTQVRAIAESPAGDLWFGTEHGAARYDGVHWQRFTTENGLSDDQVLSIAATRKGDIWVGTTGGLSRYNGHSWRTYTPADGLPPLAVLSLFEDRDGNIWAGQQSSVSKFDGTSWRTYSEADGLPTTEFGPHDPAGSTVESILQDRNGNIWVGTLYNGVGRFDGATWQTFASAYGLGQNSAVLSIEEDRAGNLWFGTALGSAVRYDGATWKTNWIGYPYNAGPVWAIGSDQRGGLWFSGGSYGVSRYDGRGWRVFNQSDGLPALTNSGPLLVSRSGNVWLAVDFGVVRFDRETLRRYTAPDSVPDFLRHLYPSASGDVWATSDYPVSASHFDGSTWTSYTVDEGVPPAFSTFLPDHEGAVWFATYLDGGYLLRFDGVNSRSYTTLDGLQDTQIWSLEEGPSGTLWAGTTQAIHRFDGASWHSVGLPAAIRPSVMREDRSGGLWVGYYGGLSRFDGSTWSSYPLGDASGPWDVRQIHEDTAGEMWAAVASTCAFGCPAYVLHFDGFRWNPVGPAEAWNPAITERQIYSDQAGNVWFATPGGVARWDGADWRTFTTADGLPSDDVFSIAGDPSGRLWIGTNGGLAEFDGTDWIASRPSEETTLVSVTDLLMDLSGDLWLLAENHLYRYSPDRVPPRTVFLTSPPPVSATGNQSASFLAAYGERKPIEYSFSFDHSLWSAWSSVGAWTAYDLPDGPHSLAVRSRDQSHNVDTSLVIAAFEVDSAPPTAIIKSPTFGSPVRGASVIAGSASDARFSRYRVEVRTSGTATWEGATVLAESSTPVVDGPLASWITTAMFPDGLYDLRLSVADSLGLVGTAQVTVLVDNVFPFANQIAPAVISSDAGGDLYTNDAELHIYFPPRAFGSDALVSISSMGAATDTLGSGAIQASPSYLLSWSAPLGKAATVEFSTQGALPGPLAVYHSANGTDWSRLGGTADKAKLSLAITSPGEYAIFTDLVPVSQGAATLSEVSFTPRVFSPAGSFAQDHLAIGFTLGHSSPVTVRVYNRAGRLVREVVSGETMPPGASLVRWDGRDRTGVPVTEGLYLVSVQAHGLTRRKTIAVVR